MGARPRRGSATWTMWVGLSLTWTGVNGSTQKCSGSSASSIGQPIPFRRRTTLALALVRQDAANDEPFTDSNTGLDHSASGVSSREELVQRATSAGHSRRGIHANQGTWSWEHHLNFRDPRYIALELSAPNEVMTGFYRELQSREVPERRSSPGLTTTSLPVGECDRSFTLGGAQITCAHTMTLLGSDGSSKLRRPQRHPECPNWQCGWSRVPRTAA